MEADASYNLGELSVVVGAGELPEDVEAGPDTAIIAAVCIAAV